MPRREHEKVISAIARRTKPFKNLTEFFTYLTVHCWNFFEYQPLMQLVLNTCSVTLKQEVKTYKSDVEEFLQRTTISEFIKCRRHLARKRVIPKSFRKLTVEHTIDPDCYTLADLETFRLDTCRHVRLSDFALQIYTITAKCFIVEWVIPNEIVEPLSLFFSSKDGQALLQWHQAENISIDERKLHSVSATTLKRCKENYYKKEFTCTGI